MRRAAVMLLLLPLLSLLLCGGASAVGQAEEQLPENVREICGAAGEDGRYDAEGALKRLADSFVQKIEASLRAEVGSAASMAAIALAVSLAMTFCDGDTIKLYINATGVCALAFILIGRMDGIVNEIRETLYLLRDYSKAAVPAVFAAAAASGAAVSAGAKYSAVCMALDVMMNTSHKLVIPLVNAYTALAVSVALFDNPVLEALKRTIKWCSVTLMTGLTLAFSAFIGITGLVTGGLDAVAVKTARTVISTTLPVVGGIVSDAASAVLSSAALIRNTAGAVGMIAVCALCAGPFAALLAKSLVIKAGSAVCAAVPGISLSRFLSDVGTAVNLLLGLLGCSAVMLFISLSSAIRTVGA